MSPAVILCLESYRPGVEAIANEVDVLRRVLEGRGIRAELLARTSGSTRRLLFLPDLLRLAARERVPGRLAGQVCHCWGLGSNLFFHLLLPETSKKLLTLIQCDGVDRRQGWIEQFEHLVVETTADRQSLLNLGLAPDRVRVIHPCARFPIGRRGDGRPTGSSRPLRLLFTSVPFVEQELADRGVDLLLEAVRAAAGGLTCTLPCRSRSVHESLRRRVYADPTLAEHVTLRLGRRDIEAELAAADVAVVPYRRPHKSFPNSVVDALTAGKPVVISRVVGAATCVEERECGVVVEPELETLLTGLEQVRCDYERLALNAIRCAEEQLSPERFATAYLDIYSKYLDV